MRYHVDGDGEPIVLLADRFGETSSWATAGYIERMASRCRLISLDMLWPGRTGATRDPASDRARRRADDIVAVLDAERLQRAHLWAYGTAGLLAYATAVRHPDRVVSLIVGGLGVGEEFDLDSVTVPAVVYAGGRDRVAETARRDAARLGAPYVVFSGLDHARAFSTVDAVAALVWSHLLSLQDLSRSPAG